MELETPNYYAIIPADVRYDKRLKLLSRFLYGEITALCNKEGYCWATNNYFAKLYDVSNETISRAISQLKEYNYISISYERTNTNIDKRKIYINTVLISTSRGIDENVKGYPQKRQGGIDENVKENNTYNNTIIEREKEELHTPIDNSYYDITTNTYINVEPKPKSEYEDFELLFIQAFNTLTVSVCSELFQLTGFRAEDKRQRLKEIFNMRKYDYKKCINKAISEAQKTPANKRWFNFLDFLKDYLINGYNGIIEVSNQPSHSRSYDDYIREEQERKINKQIKLENEAKSKGITVAELEAQNEKEINKDIDNIKNILGFGNLSEAIENSSIGIKELPKGKEYKPTPYTPKKLSEEDENQIQDLIKKARENSKHNKS